MADPPVKKTDDRHELVKYVTDDLFEEWKEERKDLETQWRRNYDACKGKYDSEHLEKWSAMEGHDWRSRVFVQVTRRKFVSGVAQIGGSVFRGGQLPINLTPTPVPESAPGYQIDPQEAETKAEGMLQVIKDIKQEVNYIRKLMSNVSEFALYGMTWTKHVLRPVKRSGYQMVLPNVGNLAIPPEIAAQYARYVFSEREVIVPTSEKPPIWEVWWDMEAESVSAGRGVIHRPMYSAYALRELAEKGGYSKAAIEKVIAEYEQKKEASGAEDEESPLRQRLASPKRNIPVYELSGRVPVEKLKGTALENETPSGKEEEVFLVIAGDAIIRQPVKHPLAAGVPRWSVARWESLPDEIGGVGIPENLEDIQSVVNGLTRALLDSARISSNLLLFGKSDALAPNQSKAVYMGRYFEVAEHIGRLDDALKWLVPPDNGPGIADKLMMFMKLADEESGIPKLAQGISDRYDPKTAFGLSQMMQGAHIQLAASIRNLDEGIIEPDIRWPYHWLMQNHPDNSVKGDYTCKATGYSTFMDKVVKGETLRMFLQFLLSDPLMRLIPKLVPFVQEIAKTLDIDFESLTKSQDEIDQLIAQNMGLLGAPPQPDVPPGQVPMPTPQPAASELGLGGML